MMDYDALMKFVQTHFTDGLALVIGSGLSAAEGIPGMPALAAHLQERAIELRGTDATLWGHIAEMLDAGHGLEAALLSHAPSETLEVWVAEETCRLLLPREREIFSAVLRGEKTLRLTRFLEKVLKPANGLPILTTNYDRLIELACEMSAYHVDTTAVGHYAGEFDHERSCMGSCRGITTRARVTVLDHYPRAIVLKPHGSFDWYQSAGDARRCSLDLNADRLIITPGLNKFRAGYNSPFDKHRDLANDYIKRSARLLIVGYGFNDDHLQTHLEKAIRDGTPTLILNRTANSRVEELSMTSPSCICLSKAASGSGSSMITRATHDEFQGPDLWDLGVLVQEMLT
jgi:hypothetical protein